MSVLSKEERESIVNEATERALLLLPEVVGNMMAQQTVYLERNKKLYGDYPEFKGHIDAVRSVIEQIEGKNPLLKYDNILEKAVPKIRERIKMLKKLDMDTISANPNRQFEKIESVKVDPHGVI